MTSPPISGAWSVNPLLSVVLSLRRLWLSCRLLLLSGCLYLLSSLQHRVLRSTQRLLLSS